MKTDKQLQRIRLSDMIKIMEGSDTDSYADNHGKFLLSGEFGINVGENRAFSRIVPIGVPILVDDSRLGLLARGEIDATVNLMDYHLEAGAAAYLGNGCIVQINRVSPDLCVKGMLLRDDLSDQIMHGQMPQAFVGKSYDVCPQTTVEERGVIDGVLQAMWRVVSHKPLNREALYAMARAMFFVYDSLFSQYSAEQGVALARRRDRMIFERFIAMVNAQCHEHRQLAYYADRLCLTERYLGTVVSQTSGTTAKEWIDRAVITAAKVMLRHTDKSISQIAYELHFANDSFFCKYFRRVAGMAPGAYRRG